MDASKQIYTNYRIMLDQIQWIDKYQAGEDIFKDLKAKPPVRRITAEERKKFEQELRQVARPKPTIQSRKQELEAQKVK